MIVVTVARKPLVAGNVASNVVAHEAGVMNIDGCRVATAPGDETTSHVQGKEAANSRHTLHPSWQGIEANYQTAGQKLGRWPSNLVLEHLPGCRRAGTRKVRGSPPTAGGMDRFNAANAAQGYRPGSYQKGEVVVAPSRLDEDGNETVAAWQCAEGCPVADLDSSSGESKSSGFGGRVVVKRRTGAERDGNLTPRFGAESRPDGAVMSSYDDAGGASRFFKQVGGDKS